MTTLELKLTLPDNVVEEAQAAGLLTPEAIERMLLEALRRREAGDRLLQIADRVAEAGVPPMTMDQINAEVKAAREARRRREAGR